MNWLSRIYKYLLTVPYFRIKITTDEKGKTWYTPQVYHNGYKNIITDACGSSSVLSLGNNAEELHETEQGALNVIEAYKKQEAEKKPMTVKYKRIY